MLRCEVRARRHSGVALGVALLAAPAAAFASERASRRSAEPAGGNAPRRVVSPGDSCPLFDHEHGAWTALLQRFVHDGVVDYTGWKAAGQPELSRYLDDLASTCDGHYERMTRKQKLAFGINAYNAYTVRLILDHFPIDSIRSIGLLPGAAFREAFIPLRLLGSDAISLNDLEQRNLRAQFGEPRIHFALVCASKGCPALRSEAYRAHDLDAQLDEAAREFVRDRRKNLYDAATRTLRLSPIFEWYRADFERAAATLPAFVARYADPAIAPAVAGAGGRVSVEFNDYDWSLNGR